MLLSHSSRRAYRDPIYKGTNMNFVPLAIWILIGNTFWFTNPLACSEAHTRTTNKKGMARSQSRTYFMRHIWTFEMISSQPYCCQILQLYLVLFTQLNIYGIYLVEEREVSQLENILQHWGDPPQATTKIMLYLDIITSKSKCWRES